jgi:hypothetical protein
LQRSKVFLNWRFSKGVDETEAESQASFQADLDSAIPSSPCEGFTPREF